MLLLTALWQLFLLIPLSASLLLLPRLEYLFVQARGQCIMIFFSRPVSEALGNPALSDKQKEGLLLSMQVLKFASEKGLETGQCYSLYCDAQHEKKMWMLSAVPCTSFVSYEWTFPFFGSFSYKGFFDHGMAAKEQDRLKSLNYDTDLGRAAGWSTLGWFPDPLTSSMLEKKPYDLAELLLHELVHKTVYLNDSVEWNENLAVICSRVLCEEFLRKSGQAHWLEEYHHSLLAEDSLLAFAEYGKAWLTQQYLRKNFQLSEKSKLMKFLVNDFLRRPWSDQLPKYKIASAIISSGNAWFQSHHRYGGGSRELSAMLANRHHGDVMSLLNALKK